MHLRTRLRHDADGHALTLSPVAVDGRGGMRLAEDVGERLCEPDDGRAKQQGGAHQHEHAMETK